jgi:hypothetical protein
MAWTNPALSVAGKTEKLVILQMVQKACQENDPAPTSCHDRMEVMDKTGCLL